MKKKDQLSYIDDFLVDKMSKRELRMLVFQLLKDETLLRNFRLYTAMKGAFL